MRILFGILFISILAINAQAKDVDSAVCKSGINYSKDKQFAVYVFCEPDALGTSIGIIATGYAAVVQPLDENKWSNTNRFWQEDVWASDIYSYEWSNDGKYLFVITDEVYGTGKKYKLDLLNKTNTEVGDGHHSYTTAGSVK